MRSLSLIVLYLHLDLDNIVCYLTPSFSDFFSLMIIQGLGDNHSGVWCWGPMLLCYQILSPSIEDTVPKLLCSSFSQHVTAHLGRCFCNLHIQQLSIFFFFFFRKKRLESHWITPRSVHSNHILIPWKGMHASQIYLSQDKFLAFYGQDNSFPSTTTIFCFFLCLKVLTECPEGLISSLKIHFIILQDISDRQD